MENWVNEGCRSKNGSSRLDSLCEGVYEDLLEVNLRPGVVILEADVACFGTRATLGLEPVSSGRDRVSLAKIVHLLAV